MAADINDKFTEATNGSRPVATTLTALLPSGASPGTATCGALTGWPTATAVHFIIYTIDVNGNKVSGSQTDWKGIVSGSTITGLVLKAGTNNGYSIGAVVEAAPTAAWADDLTEGIMVEHNQNGTHGAITATSLVASGNSTAASHISTGDSQLRSYSLESIHGDIYNNCVLSGGTVAQSAGLTGTFSDIVYYYGGRRYTKTGVSNKTYTASKDTYVYLDTSGTVTYSEVANNAASPAATSNALLIAIVITSGAAITSVNQGSPEATAPTTTGSVPVAVCDTLGNLIYPKPNQKLLGVRIYPVGAGVSTTSTTAVALNAGLNITVLSANCKNGANVKATLASRAFGSNNVSGIADAFIAITSATGTGIANASVSGNTAAPLNITGLKQVSSDTVFVPAYKTNNAAYTTAVQAYNVGIVHMVVLE